MSSTDPDLFDVARDTHIERRNWECTLDNVRLEAQCPLDNGRHDCTVSALTGTSPRLAACANNLDKLPLELRVQVVLFMDIPSLTRLRGLSRRVMALVDAVPEYAAIIKHCPNIIRAIVSIEADGFDCLTLFNTLCTSQCASCNHFGYYFYLISHRAYLTTQTTSLS